MKIGPIETKPPGITPAERKSEAAPSKAGAAPEPSTAVAWSAAASGLAAGAAEASFDSAKVERIASAIREGRFTVNPEAIADKLIGNAEELLGRKLS